MLDVAKIRIGNNVMFGSECIHLYRQAIPSILTAGIPDMSTGSSVTIGNNVWIGGSCVILPGVTIGDNAVIGAGSGCDKGHSGQCLRGGKCPAG